MITRRSYFDNCEDALKYSASVLYPSDGIVAVRDDSTEILKVKTVKSMELQVCADQRLCTSEGREVLHVPASMTDEFELGSIVEVRFELKSQHTITVRDMFVRTDKHKANSTGAVSNIIRSANKMVAPGDNERRVALLWCNELRKTIYVASLNMHSTRSIILDVGTGTGQSLDAIGEHPSVSYILMEPD
ncbi:hypothetical protein F5883DRAFT_434391, partial [Diaporthe sp. PMI_573]